MTPLDKARDAFKGQWKDNVLLFDNTALDRDLRAAITAFLEAAAEDADTAIKAGHAADSAALNSGPSYCHIGKAAILALKEAVG